jgi:TRAP-type mannitol/chloroaromatic compound transport system permease large subunit
MGRYTRVSPWGDHRIEMALAAAALGAFGSIVLTIAYGNFTLKAVKETVVQTLRISSMMMIILVGGSMFSGIFLGMGGGGATEKYWRLCTLLPGECWSSSFSQSPWANGYLISAA